VLYAWKKKAPPLREAVRWITSLGGFLGRKGDGDPGHYYDVARSGTSVRHGRRVATLPDHAPRPRQPLMRGVKCG